MLTNTAESSNIVALGENFAHKYWRDFLSNREDDIITDEHGNATFPVNGGRVSVWVMAERNGKHLPVWQRITLAAKPIFAFLG